jgi:hypothetical protein
MTKFLIASAATACSLVLVLLSVDKPKLTTEPAPVRSIKTAVRPQAVEPAADVAQQTGKEKPYPKLQARNIFSADGAYSQSAEQKPLGEASLTLLGVIGGKTKKAIFRDPTGAIIAAGEGETFLNGAVISRIERLGVTVSRGDEKKEFVIFDMKSGSRRDG